MLFVFYFQLNMDLHYLQITAFCFYFLHQIPTFLETQVYFGWHAATQHLLNAALNSPHHKPKNTKFPSYLNVIFDKSSGFYSSLHIKTNIHFDFSLLIC